LCLITDTFAASNGGVCRNDSGKLVMNGGEVSNNKSLNSNGTFVMLYMGSMEMKGGKICSNSGISGTANSRCGFRTQRLFAVWHRSLTG
jgi:hypothetical protein